MNVTVPVAAEGAIVAVRVIEAPATAVLVGVAVRVVVVLAAPELVMV